MTKCSFRLLLLAAVSIALSACGLNNAILKTNAAVDLKSKGVAIMSLGYAGTKAPYQAYWIQVSPLKQPAEEVTFFTSPNNMFSDNKQAVVSSSGKADLVALDLAPGEYQIDKVGAFTDTGPYSPIGLKRPPLTPSKFAVVAGEVTYLGSALLQRKPDGALAYVVIDEFDRDIKLLRNIRPDLGSLTIQKTLLSSKPFL